MAKFKIIISDYTFEVHSATCPDPARKWRKRECWGEPWTVEYPNAEAAMAGELGQIFGSATDRDGVDRDDCNYADAGYEGRVFPCCKKNA